ncbi:MAG: YeeE/YedE thiosulfate transporter family protein [Pseudomonas sp.]
MTGSVPLAALAGGALIGTGAVALWWLNGRIAGVSGILGRALTGPAPGEQALFLLGLVLGAGLFLLLGGHAPVPRPPLPVALLAAAGLLVGYGTALGNGCTSGHGVCGLARLSPRSLAATVVFLLAAFATTWTLRHALGIAL